MIRNRFHWFLAASLLVHAGAFLAWSGGSQHEIAMTTAAPPLQLALRPASRDTENEVTEPPADASVNEAESVDAARSVEKIAETGAVEAIADSAPASATLPDRLLESVPPAGRSIEPPAVAAAQPVESATLSDAEIRERLHEAVETHFYYPPLARRRGWEGEVMIGVRVEGDGRLSAVDVVSSSGYRVLDRAAVDSLKRMARLQDSGSLPPGGVEFEIPVRYVLLDRPA